MASFSLLLSDSHALLRSCLRLVLEVGVPGLHIREASSVEEALNTSYPLPTLVLLAMEAREEQAVHQAVSRLRERWPDVSLVLLFSSERSASLGQPPCYGAAADKLIRIVRLMRSGTQDGAADTSRTDPFCVRPCGKTAPHAAAVRSA